MRWRNLRRSDNVVEDRSGGSPLSFGGGRGGGLKLGGGGLLLVVLVSWLLGFNPLEILSLLEGRSVSMTPQSQPHRVTPSDDPTTDFVRAVLGSTEDTWSRLFSEQGGQYQAPRLVLFQQAVQSACGLTSAAAGPFYCPGDRQLYLDLSFFQELSQRFGAPGDFARAYVIAHEVGHHVQNLTGIFAQVQGQRQRFSDEGTDAAVSVRLELQADCLAGVWGYYAQQQGVLETGDIQEALRAATEIGDDRLQMQTRGYVTPDSFTHGTSDQRVHWFSRGLKTGDLNQCNTFATNRL